MRTNRIILPVITFASEQVEQWTFTGWIPWMERASLGRMRFGLAGVYLLAHFAQPPRDSGNVMAEEIIYIGATHGRSFKACWQRVHDSAFEGQDKHAAGIAYREIFGDDGRTLYVAASPQTESTYHLASRPSIASIALHLAIKKQLLTAYQKKWGRKPACNRK